MTDVLAASPARSKRARERDVWLSVGGMSCGSCAARLEGRLHELNGVFDATVNYATGRAHVRTSVPTESLLHQVEEAGFTARPVAGWDENTPDEIRADADRRVRSLGRRLIVAGLLFMPLCDVSIAFSLVPSLRVPGWQWLVVALSLPVVTWCAWPFYSAAFRQARRGVMSMDTLASLGILAACAWSAYGMFASDLGTRSVTFGSFAWRGPGAVYLDVAAGVTTFLLAGRYFEARCRRRAVAALGALAAVGAKEVTVLDEHGTERRVPVEELAHGDTFILRAGETVAADGLVTSGRAVLDRSAMTGEATPTEVGPGDRVVGGTIALGGHLVVRAEAVGRATQLAQMRQLVANAQNEKAAAQRLADRIAGYFVPAVLAASVVTLLSWILAGASPGFATNAALSVVIIACPCALGLATPMTLLVASDRGARSGIFFKGYEALEQSGVIDVVLFDKTGTVTDGRLSVTGVVAAAGRSEDEVIHVAGSLEYASEHPIGRALVLLAQTLGELSQADTYRALPGMGVEGTIRGRSVSVRPFGSCAGGCLTGAPAMDERVESHAESWVDGGRTVLTVSEDDQVIGVIALAHSLRPGAGECLETLHRLGLRCVLLTGDNERAGGRVAASCGFDDFIAGVSPRDKVAVVARMQHAGHSVAMVGDGINDGPALAQAHLGLALGSGTDVARHSADILIVRDELRAVPAAIMLARRAHATIRANLLWAFSYNIVAIPLAAVGLLDPVIAAAAMSLSSAFVVWNSARLRHFVDPALSWNGVDR